MNTLSRKRLMIFMFVFALTSWRALGDGYFLFSGSVGAAVWENFSSGNFQRATGTVNVTFLWGPGNTVPLVDALAPFTPTNSTVGGPFAWNDILNDPTFTLATNSATGQAAIVTVASPSGSYNSGSFPVAGTTAGDTYTVYVVAWPKTYVNPQLAAAAGSLVGWSNPFQYQPADQVNPPLPFFASGVKSFGVNVPEPSILTVAGAGMAILFARRRFQVKSASAHAR